VTLITAWRTRDGQAYLAADTAQSTEDLLVHVKDKVWRATPEILLGACGDFPAITLLRRFDWEGWAERYSEPFRLVAELISEMGESWSQHDCAALLVTKETILYFDTHGVVSEFLGGFAAIGVAAQFAYGYRACHWKLSGRAQDSGSIRDMYRCAEERVPGVAGEPTILSVPWPL
jgi:ATP-dependent protease HslVU (ClpYQ) peptidase subunit